MYWSPVFDCSHTSPLFWRPERALHLLEERGVERGHLRCEGLSVRYGALREDGLQRRPERQLGQRVERRRVERTVEVCVFGARAQVARLAGRRPRRRRRLRRLELLDHRDGVREEPGAGDARRETCEPASAPSGAAPHSVASGRTAASCWSAVASAREASLRSRESSTESPRSSLQ